MGFVRGPSSAFPSGADGCADFLAGDVASGMVIMQPELEQLCHVCKKRYRGT